MPTILAVGTSVPDFVATNDYVISLVIEHSRRFYNGEIAELEQTVRLFLDRAGAKRRRWRSGFTKPLEHIADAWLNCFTHLDSSVPKRIGALIYCGIDKGVVEPSHASLLARKFGLDDARTLDISDACMGWFTATQVARSLVTSDKPYCAIISAEFPIEVPGKVYPEALKVRNQEDLAWKGAALTLGECASVTVVHSADQSGEQRVFKANNEMADLCCVPLERPDRFVDSERLLGRLTANCFVAHMGKMASAAYRDGQDVLRRYVAQYGAPDVLLPHTVSQTGPEHASKSVIGRGVLRNCFEVFGNIATSSLPVGYEYYDCAGKRHLHVAGWISAAGMSHCVFRLS